MYGQAANETALDQKDGSQGDGDGDGDDDDDDDRDQDEDVPAGNSASPSPGHATVEPAAATAPTTVGDGSNEGSQQDAAVAVAVLQRPESTSSAPDSSSEMTEAGAPSAGASGVSDAMAQAEEAGVAGKAVGAQKPLACSEDAQSEVALATTRGDEGEGLQQTAARAKELRVHKEFLAMLGERNYDEKRQTLDYLADPTSRADNPRLPAVPAERKQAVLLAGRTVKSWPRDVVMDADYEGLSADLADERIRAQTEWRSAPCTEWMQLVPPMKRRAQQPTVRGGRGGDPSPRRGREGSAFQVFRCDSEESAEDAGAAAGNKRPRLGASTRPGYDGYDDDELTPMVRRLDEQDRDSAIAMARRPVTGASPAATFSPGTATPNALARVPGGASRTPNPARAGGAARAAVRDRRRSSGAPLRYRYRSKDYTPRVHKRQSLVGAGGPSFGAGTLGDWLGGTGTGTGGSRSGPSPSPGAISAAKDGRHNDPNRLSSSPGRGGETSASKANSGGRGQARDGGSPAAGSKRAASSLGLGLSGMNATPRKRVLEEAVAREGEMLVRKVEAEAQATAFVENILMEAVSKESKTRDVGRQVREEQALRADKKNEQQQQQQQQRVSTGQVRGPARIFLRYQYYCTVDAARGLVMSWVHGF